MVVVKPLGFGYAVVIRHKEEKRERKREREREREIEREKGERVTTEREEAKKEREI